MVRTEFDRSRCHSTLLTETLFVIGTSYRKFVYFYDNNHL